MITQDNERPFGYRISETARRLNCTERTVYRYLSAKKLRAKRVCGLVLVTDESLSALVSGSPDWVPQSAATQAAAA